MFNSTTKRCMECLSLCFNRYLCLVVSFVLLSILEGQAQYPVRTDDNYYVYGKSTPALNDIGEIAHYYNTTIEYILDYNYNNYNEDFSQKKFLFEDTLSQLYYKYSQENTWLHNINYRSFARKMLKYEYAHLFPLEEGDTLWLPIGSVYPIDRTTHFEAFDKLFADKKTELIKDSLLGNYIDFALLYEISEIIPFKLWECVADTVQENAFIGGLASFKFAYNTEMTAYLIKAEYEKPYSAYLYLFRNSDKKLVGEEPILVYYKDESTPCRYRTDTKITDHNQDGFLDLIIYQKEECFGATGSSSNYTYRILIWDEEESNFYTGYESIDTYRTQGRLESASKVRDGFNKIKYDD